MRILKTRRTFKKEFKRQLRFAITAGIGFTIAFAWRNAIYDSFHQAVARFSASTQGIQSDLVAALAITLAGVLTIFITARLLRE